jgi:ABC-type transporter MlaC component
MKHLLLICFFSIVYTNIFAAPQPSKKPLSLDRASADSGQALARSVVNRLYTTAKDITSGKTSEKTKADQLTELVLSIWDIDKIASYILFPHWKSFSNAQKTQFENLLTQNVVRTFQRVSKKYLGSLTITKIAPVQNKPNAYDVHCKVINAEDGRTVDVRFQIASGKVRNLFVEKLDLVDAKRKEYASLMRQNRHSIPAFLKAIENQVSKRNATSKPASVRKA